MPYKAYQHGTSVVKRNLSSIKSFLGVMINIFYLINIFNLLFKEDEIVFAEEVSSQLRAAIASQTKITNSFCLLMKFFLIDRALSYITKESLNYLLDSLIAGNDWILNFLVYRSCLQDQTKVGNKLAQPGFAPQHLMTFLDARSLANLSQVSKELSSLLNKYFNVFLIQKGTVFRGFKKSDYKQFIEKYKTTRAHRWRFAVKQLLNSGHQYPSYYEQYFLSVTTPESFLQASRDRAIRLLAQQRREDTGLEFVLAFDYLMFMKPGFLSLAYAVGAMVDGVEFGWRRIHHGHTQELSQEIIHGVFNFLKNIYFYLVAICLILVRSETPFLALDQVAAGDGNILAQIHQLRMMGEQKHREAVLKVQELYLVAISFLGSDESRMPEAQISPAITHDSEQHPAEDAERSIWHLTSQSINSANFWSHRQVLNNITPDNHLQKMAYDQIIEQRHDSAEALARFNDQFGLVLR